MTWRVLSPRDRRALALGALVTAASVGLARGVPAWVTWVEGARGAAAEAADERVRVRGSVTMRRALADSLAARGRRLVALAPAFLNGDSPAAAGGALASLVSGAAAASGVRLGAVQVRHDSAASGAFARVAVRADVVGDIRGVTRLLLALERGPTLLAVRELSITQPAPAAPADQPEALRVELVVEGLALKPVGRAGE